MSKSLSHAHVSSIWYYHAESGERPFQIYLPILRHVIQGFSETLAKKTSYSTSEKQYQFPTASE